MSSARNSRTIGPITLDTFRREHPQTGRETTQHLTIGPLMVALSLGRGQYGYPDSPHASIRVCWAKDKR